MPATYYQYNGYEIVREAYNRSDVIKEKIICPKCDSKNISILKGDGRAIIGPDYIGIICNDCKKVYGFKGVQYRENYPKEL